MQVNNYPQQYVNKINPKTKIGFQGLLHMDTKTKVPLDSWFFRDIKTLNTAAIEIKNTFPQGADILDFACSNGEETISLKSLLEEPQYKVVGYDTSESALKLARKGVYTVFSNWYDSFLLDDKTQGCKNELKNKFNKIMTEIDPEPLNKLINNKIGYFTIKNGVLDFKEKFFKILAEKQKEIDIRRGSILDIENLKNNRLVGAIFFRNALYQICGNDLNETIEQRKYLDTPKVDKKMIIENFVNKIHKKISNGGIIVIGEHIKDHLFVADDKTPEWNTIRFKDTEFYNPDNKKHVQSSELKLFKTSPLVTEFKKDNRFIPVGFSKTFLDSDGPKIKVATIWKKIR